MDDLLYLAIRKRAEKLKLRIGKPPIIVLRGKLQVIRGPEITAEDAERFLLSIANTRQRRHFRERGWVEFFYMYRDTIRFLVLVRIGREDVEFDIQ